MKKRILAALLASLFCALAIVPMTVSADEAEKTLPEGLVINCVGDSITWGSGSTNKIDGKCDKNAYYPGQLEKLIGEDKCTIYVDAKPGASLLPDYAPGSISQGGYATVKDIMPSFSRTDLDVVILMLGTNDSKITATEKGTYKVGIWDKRGAAENFKAEYREMLDIYFNMESKPFVYCMLPPPALPNEVAPNYRITDANMKNEIIPIINEVIAECQAEGLPVGTIDIRSAFPDPETQQAELVKVLADGVHPNAAGYTIMAETIYKQMLSDTHTLSYSAEGVDDANNVPKGTTFFGNAEIKVKSTRGLVTKDGVANTGWSTEPNGAGTVYAEGDVISFSAGASDVTLYPVFAADATPEAGTPGENANQGAGINPVVLAVAIGGGVLFIALIAVGVVILKKNGKKA